jgi:hypothetical protein
MYIKQGGKEGNCCGGNDDCEESVLRKTSVLRRTSVFQSGFPAVRATLITNKVKLAWGSINVVNNNFSGF